MDPVTLGLTLVDEDGGRRDVRIVATPDTPVGEVLTAANAPSGGWHSEGSILDPEAPILETSIRHGSSLDRRSRQAFSGVGVELVVRNGRDTGRVIRLGEGTHQIGRVLGTHKIDDPSVSRLHAEFLVTATSVSVRDLGSSNGTGVRGVAVDGRQPIVDGDAVNLGDVTLTVRTRRSSDAALDFDPVTRARVFNRPGRFRRPRPTLIIERDRDAAAVNLPGFPWTTLLAPVAAGLVGVFVFSRPEMLLLSGVGPVASVAQYIVSRRKAVRENTAARETADSNANAFATEIGAAVRAERQWLVEGDPDLVDVLEIAQLPSKRLWERRRNDPDFLSVRIGVANLPSEVRLAGVKMEPPLIADAPVALDLRGAGVSGLSGSREAVTSLAIAMVVRVAVTHSPDDVRIVVLPDLDRGSHWEWAKWLPHLGGARQAWIADSPDFRKALIEEIASVVKARSEMRDLGSRGATQAVLVVAENCQPLRGYDDFLTLLRDGPEVGVLTLALETDAARLPAETRAHVRVGHPRAVLQRANADDLENVMPETLAVDHAEEAARALAPIRLAGEGESGFPDSVRLLDLIDLPTQPDTLRDQWTRSGPITSVTVGVTESGPFAIDLARDGPHTLIAGTTGSGKTELLQSLLGALARANAPDRLGFLLVDYKGGGDFADLARLPHTLGVVSNLDERLTRRAIVALRAEMERRQGELSDLRRSGAITEANVKAAWKEAPDQARTRQLGRLVIVVDEFALFARNLPAFVEGLVQLTEQGRSLGMHLILSVQRAGGVVTPGIRANTSLRIVMRTAPGESMEVLESPQADLISKSTPGRGYVRIGDPPVLTEFQSARVGGARPSVATARPPASSTPFSWGRLAGAGQPTQDGVGSDTDLSFLVGILLAACEGLEIPPNPWPAPLPDRIPSSSLPTRDVDGIAWALVDRPSERSMSNRTGLFTFDPVAPGGNVAIVGGSKSGRTSSLMTLANQLVEKYGPTDLQLIPLDLALGDLKGLARYTDMVGPPAVDADHAETYLTRLAAEIERRRRIGIHGVPTIVLLVDRLDLLIRRYELGSDSERQVLAVLREGPGVGIRTVATGDTSLLSGRMREHWGNIILLALPDPDRYREFGVDPRGVPENLPPGRGYLAESGIELQFAIDDRELIEREGTPIAGGTGAPQVVVRPVPAHCRANDLIGAIAVTADRLRVPVGIGGDQAQLLYVDLTTAGGGFVVAGGRSSGKSNALSWFAIALKASSVPYILISGTSPDALSEGARESAIAVLGPEADGQGLADTLASHVGRLVVLVDDADRLARRARTSTLSALKVVRAYVDARLGTAAVVVAGNLDSLMAAPTDAIGLALAAETAVIFGPSSLDLRSLGVRSPTEAMLRAGPAGRGLLIAGGDVSQIQVPEV